MCEREREKDKRDHIQVMTLCYWVNRGFCACLAEGIFKREGCVHACNVKRKHIQTFTNLMFPPLYGRWS